MPSNKKKEIYLLIGSLFLSFIILEIGLRITTEPIHTISDPKGWAPQEFLTRQSIIEDTEGNFRNVTNSYFKNGFKRWGDPHTGKKKILLIGDSFTDMKYVSNGEEFYSYLEGEKSPFELFVFGSPGYGTYQEFLVLDEFFDEIKPDIVIIQFDGSDYFDNVYSYDLLRYPFRIDSYVPYLENNKTIYRLPKPFASIRSVSRIADLFLHEVDKRESNKIVSFQEFELHYQRIYEEIGDDQFMFEKVREILTKIKERIGNADLYLLSTGSLTEYDFATLDQLEIVSFEVGSVLAEYEKKGFKLGFLRTLIGIKRGIKL